MRLVFNAHMKAHPVECKHAVCCSGKAGSTDVCLAAISRKKEKKKNNFPSGPPKSSVI